MGAKIREKNASLLKTSSWKSICSASGFWRHSRNHVCSLTLEMSNASGAINLTVVPRESHNG